MPYELDYYVAARDAFVYSEFSILMNNYAPTKNETLSNIVTATAWPTKQEREEKKSDIK